MRHFIHRAIATHGDDEFKTFADGFRRQPPGVTRGRRGLECAITGHVAEMTAKMAGLVTPRGGVEDDTGAHAPNDSERRSLVEDKARSNFPMGI